MVPRSLSLGSIDEQSSNSIFPQPRVLSMPMLPYPRPFSRGPSPLARRPPRVLNVYDSERMPRIEQLRRDPMFVGLQGGHEVNFVFPRPYSSHTPPPSRHSTYSTCSRRDSDSVVLLRSPSITNHVERSSGHSKVPLFVPSQIIKPVGPLKPFEHEEVLPQDHSPSSFNPQLVNAPEETKPSRSNGRPSKESMSCASDWSTTVQFESTLEEIEPSMPLSTNQSSPQSVPDNASSLPVSHHNLSSNRLAQAIIPAVDGHRSETDITLKPASRGSLRRKLVDTVVGYFRRLKHQARGRARGREHRKESLPMG